MDSMESKKSPVFELAAASVHRTLVFRRLRIPTTIKKQAPKWVPAFLAEDEGFEPPQTESESGVLPLHKSSMLDLTVLLYAKKSKCQVLFLKNFIFLFRSLLPWPGSACQNHFFQISEGLLFSLFRQHGQHKTQLPPCFRVHQRLFF